MPMLMYGGRHEAAVGARKPGLAPHNPPNQCDITDSHNCTPTLKALLNDMTDTIRLQ